MAVYSVRKQLVTFAFLILGVAAFIVTLIGLGGSSIVLIANYQACPSPEIPVGANPPPGYVLCDYGWKGIHAVLGVQNWNLYQCLGSQTWAPSVIIYLDKTTSTYAPGCPNAPYFLGLGLVGMTTEVGFYVYEVRLSMAKDKILSFVKGGTPEQPTAYANAKFDFLAIKKQIAYSPEIFGALETEAQRQAAQEIKAGNIDATFINYISNDKPGRMVIVHPQSFNDSFHFGEPYTVQIGFFPRVVAGTALVTGIYLGMETRAPLPIVDLKKYGLDKEIPTWQRSKLVVMLTGEESKSEKIPWYYVDDCDARRRDFQNKIYEGRTPADRTIDLTNLTKLGAFVQYHDSLPYLNKIEEQKARADGLEKKLWEMEAHGINVDAIEKKKPGDLFAWPQLPRPVKWLLGIGLLVGALAFGYYVVGISVDRYLLQIDLNQISQLIQTTPDSTKPGLLNAQKELQQAYTDLQSNGVGAYSEVAKALSDAGQAIAQAIQQSAPQPPVTSTSLNSNSTTTSSHG